MTAKKTAIMLACVLYGIFPQNLAAQSKMAGQRETLINYAKTFIGTPYLFGGATRQGMDCSGFIFTAVKDSLGITIPRTTSQLYKYTQPVSTVNLEAGDLVFFKTTSANTVSHVGIYIGRNQFIHSASDGPNTGVIISSLNESYWKRTYFSAASFLPAQSKTGTGQNAAEAFGSDKPDSRPEKPSIDKKKFAPKSETLKGVTVETSGMFNWSLFTAKGFKPDFRGVNFNAGFLFNDKFALNLGIRYDKALDAVMMPITMQFALGYGFRFYWGISPDFKKDAPLPLVAGFSWQIKLFENKSFKLSFVQDISYTVANLVSPSSYFAAFPSKLCFSTGIRVAFPLY